MNYQEKQEYLQQISFLDMDFNRIPGMLGSHLQKNHEKKGWTQTMIAELMGKERSHINKAERNTSDMGITMLFMFYVVNDLDMNHMMNEFFEELLKADRVLKKKKKTTR